MQGIPAPLTKSPRPGSARAVPRLLMLALLGAAAALLAAAAGHASPAGGGAPSGRGQSPINVIFDMHADPLPQQAPYPQKEAYYAMQLDNGNWVLDRTEPLGVKISFLACGEFMEFAAKDGPHGPGADFLRRIFASGEQIGSHSHSEYRRAAFDWPSFPNNATFAQCLRSWQDNIDWVNTAVVTALGDPPPIPLAEINAVKGAHLPDNEKDYRSLMIHFGLKVRQGGPEEDYVALYDHYIMNPFRPAVDNPMGEDLSGPFVVSPQGAVIGKNAVHHGILQDMTAPNVKRIFLQTYLNWRYRDRLGLPGKVWCFGWAGHNHDFEPGSAVRADMVEMTGWLAANFVDAVEPTGSVIARWNTQKGTADEYFAWEAAHPGVSSFDSNGTHLDWNDYPYLRAVCVELWGAHHAEDLDLGAGIRAWRLVRGPLNIAVAFSDVGPRTVDLSSFLSAPCRVVGAETGLLEGTDPARVVVGAEPVIVTEAAPTLSMRGVPAIGETVFFAVHGEPDALGAVFASGAPAFRDIPYVGKLLIDPGAGLNLLGYGVMTQGTFTQPLAIPDNPDLVGRTFHLQGLEKRENGATLTVNALAVTVL